MYLRCDLHLGCTFSDGEKRAEMGEYFRLWLNSIVFCLHNVLCL